VGFGHVRGEGRVLAAAIVPEMRRDPLPAGEDLDRGRGRSDIDQLVHQRMGDRIVMTVELHMSVWLISSLRSVGARR